jgi:glyoxylase-like metal-dependent hydrolase (beta-lactamase superfamily II)
MLPLRTPTLPPATHTNAYLLGTGPAVLVDPGSPWAAEQQALLAALRDAERTLGRRVEAVWLTHHHPDHVGGAAAVAEALGVPLRAHAETAARLALRGLVVDGTLADGQVHELGAGFRVRVLHTPGHARGHLCFHVEADGTLLCGDLISALSTIVIDPPEGRMADYLESLARARDLRPRYLFPAHGPVLRDGERALEAVIAHRGERERRVLAAWREGMREPAALVAAAYDELAAGLGPVAERQVAAHLDHLRERGDL